MPLVDLDDLEPVEGDPFDPKQGFGTLKPDNPSWGDRIAGGFSNFVGMLGAPTGGQRNAYDIAQKGVGLIPGVSNAVSGNQAYRDFGQGNYAGGLLNTVGAIAPPIPGASGAVEEATGAASRNFAKELSQFGPSWRKAPVIDATGNVVHGSITPGKTVGGNLGILDEQGNLNKGLLSYHGSPHDWGTVDLSKIGTGEGTTDEGWGFYSATHPKVAQTYSEMGESSLVDSAGNPVEINTVSDFMARDALERGKGDFDAARGYVNRAAKWGPPSTREQFSGAADVLGNWQDAGHTMEKSENRYMLATQHDPDAFLDFNKKLTDQSPAVQEAAKNLGDFHPDATGKDVHNFVHADEEFRDEGGDVTVPNDPKDYVHGAGGIDEPVSSEAYQRAATRMKQSGFPGVKYLDNLSEQGTAPAKTYNYVTYDDAIKVLKRYGVAGLGGVGLGGLMMNHPNMPSHQLEEQD